MRVLVCIVIAAASAAAQPAYKDVAAIVQDQCLGCHASQVKMGSLNLETYQGLMTGGTHGAVIVPGKSAESRLFLMVTGKAAPLMPMNGGRLTGEQIVTIKQWIDAGAKGPDSAAKAPESPEAAPKPSAKLAHIEPKTTSRQIFDLAISPDGKLLALAGFQTVRLLETASNKTVAELKGEADTVRAMAFSPDGTMLAAAGGLPARSGEVQIWDVARRELVRTIHGHADCIYGIAFSPDGKTLATSSYDKLIKLWDLATGNEIRTYKDHIDAVYAVAFTPDGKRLVSGGADRTVKIWDVASGERLFTLSEPQDGINAIALDPSGKLVAAGGLDKTIRIWSLGEKSGTLRSTLIAHEDAILRLAWSPDAHYLLSSSADREVKLYNVPDLTEVAAFPQTDWVYGLTWSPDSKSFVEGRFDGTWDVRGAAAKGSAVAAK